MARLREHGDRHPLGIGMGISAGERPGFVKSSRGAPTFARACGSECVVRGDVRGGSSHSPPPRDRGVPRRAKWMASPLRGAECRRKTAEAESRGEKVGTPRG